MGMDEKSMKLQDKLISELRRFLFADCPAYLQEAAEYGDDDAILQLVEGLEADGVGFGDTSSDKYKNLYFDCVYYLRYGLAYACEYAFLYEVVIKDLERNEFYFDIDRPLKVVSLGCGGELDKWSLLYAASVYDCGKEIHDGSSYHRCLQYEGVDYARWGLKTHRFDPCFSDGFFLTRDYSYPTFRHESCFDYLKDCIENPRMIDILIFPRIISELDYSKIKDSSNILRDAISARMELCSDSLYIIFAHSSRQSKAIIKISSMKQNVLLDAIREICKVTDLLDDFIHAEKVSGSFDWVNQLERVTDSQSDETSLYAITYGFKNPQDDSFPPYFNRIMFPDGRKKGDFSYPYERSEYPDMEDFISEKLKDYCFQLHDGCEHCTSNGKCRMGHSPVKKMSLSNFSVFRIDRR